MSKAQKVTDILARFDRLISDRQGYEGAWQSVATYFIPSLGGFNRNLSTAGRMMLTTDGPESRKTADKRWDGTALSAFDRMCNGILSMVAPDNEEWHNLKPDDPLSVDIPTGDQQWFDDVTRFLFSTRYNPASGFSSAAPKAMRSCGAFSVGVIFVENGFDSASRLAVKPQPIVYSHVPLSSIWLGVNAQDEYDTAFRKPNFTVRQLAQRFGKDNLSDKLKEKLVDPKKWDDIVNVVHAVYPREEWMPNALKGSIQTGAYESVWIEADTKHVIAEGGYFEFPYAVLTWWQAEGSAYGDSPCMTALDNVRGLNLMRKVLYRSAQQYVDPALARSAEGMMNRISLNPGAMNVGALDRSGNYLVKPLVTGADPQKAKATLDGDRDEINDMLYNNLFLTMVADRQRTAQEILERSGERADLLGPNGVRIIGGFARMVDRELGILERLGAFRPGSILAAPQSMQGRGYSFKSDTPLDRLREQKKLLGVHQTIETAMLMANAGKQDVLDGLDGDEILRISRRANGAPSRMLLSEDKLLELRQQRAEQMQQAQQAEQAAMAAEAMGKAAPAMKVAQEAQAQ